MQTAEYHCPGQPYPISRAVHLGRLAGFYPGCRQCRHRNDTGTLSRRRVERLVETRARGLPRPLFHEEGAGGEYLNDLGPETAREMAAALGLCLRRRTLLPGNTVADATGSGPPVVAIAGDGRPMSGEMVAAVGEGLRWAGCEVVDIGPASAACLAFAVEHLQTGGGILVGNPGDRPQTVGLKFWAALPGNTGPLSAGGTLDVLKEVHRQGLDRPTRTYGSLRRFRAETPYLNALAERYHALRPLRIVLDTACEPVSRYFNKLTEGVACRIISCRTSADRLPARVVAERAHFAVRIGDDGEILHVFDEQGRQVPAERLLLLIAPEVLREDPQAAIVLEEGTEPRVVESLGRLGCHTVISNARRANMAAAIHQHGAKLGGGRTGRFWYTDLGPPLPDALITLTRLLQVLSRGDRPLSEVLDRETTSA